jgi:RNA polymerase sigma-70 factor (ECF subfamily)
MALETLLDRLCAGDDVAAGEAFRAYEPHLRMVVRRLLSARLRAKFDSVDVVQSVWADLLSGFRSGAWSFANAAVLRSFLVRTTRNRFLNRMRHHRHALAHEQPLAEGAIDHELASPEPRPSEIAQADELWDRLLAQCPPEHRELLRLKRQGVPLAELAARTGLHPSSVRRILYQLSARLAEHRQENATEKPVNGHNQRPSSEGIVPFTPAQDLRNEPA